MASGQTPVEVRYDLMVVSREIVAQYGRGHNRQEALRASRFRFLAVEYGLGRLNGTAILNRLQKRVI